MNIALVHDWITNLAGAERVLLVLADIFPEADIYTSVYEPGKAKEFAGKKINTTYLQKIPLLRRYRELLVPYTPLAFESLDLSKYDVVITNTTFSAKGIITKPETVHICYCHTPTRYLWESDIDTRTEKGFMQGTRRKIAHDLRLWDRMAAERPDFYIANSHTIQRRIKKYYDKESLVIYPPVDTEKFVPQAGVKAEDYYLFVSRLVDYKRADIVTEAFNRLGLPLKIIGTGPEQAKLNKMAKKNIEFLGRVGDEDLKKYYSTAKAFIFAAEEDFGIVPVEAMAAGRPVIAYARGGASETVIDGETGVHFNEQTPESIIEAVRKFQKLEFDQTKICEQAQKFSQKRFVEEFSGACDKFISEYQRRLP